MLEKFQAIEELQSELRGFCPAQRLDAYKCGKANYLSKVHNQFLHSEYPDDLKRVLERQRVADEDAGVGAVIDLDDTESEINDDLLPNYEEWRKEVLNTWARLYPNVERSQSANLPVMTTTFEGSGTTSKLQCYSCDGYGHYAGDKDCPNPG